jgi:hypothetical protein
LQVLGLPKPISVTADFFMTGGTSLQVGWLADWLGW